MNEDKTKIFYQLGYDEGVNSVVYAEEQEENNGE